jgi:hypothetical protein
MVRQTAFTVLAAISVCFAEPPAAPTLIDPTKPAYAVSWRQLADGTAGFVLSSATEAKVTVEITPLACSAGAPADAPVIPLVLATSNPVMIHANVPQRMTIQRPNSRPPACIYSGTVLIKDANGTGKAKNSEKVNDSAKGQNDNKTGNLLSAVPITVTVPGPEPLLNKHTVTVWRMFPWPDSPVWRSDFDLPLRDNEALRGLGGREVGAVRRDAGGWTRVKWKPKDEKAEKLESRLLLDTPPFAGTYANDLNLTGDDPSKTQLNLTVIVKDFVLWPILLIVVATLLAYWVKRYVGVIRVTLPLRIREANLGKAFEIAQHKFLASTKGTPSADYSITGEFSTLRTQIRNSLSVAEKTFSSTLDQKDTNFQQALTTLQQLEDVIRQWPTFGDSLAQLRQAVAEVRQSLNGQDIEPPAPKPADPAFVASAGELLHGAAIPIPQVGTTNDTAVKSRTLSLQWMKARQATAELTAGFRDLPEDVRTGDQGTALRHQLVTLWGQLGDVNDATGLTAVVAQIDQCRNQLRLIQGDLSNKGAVKFAELTAQLPDSSLETEAAVPVPASVEVEPLDDSRRARFLERQIAFSDGKAIAFSAFVALVTGLNMFYFGNKAFGTLGDYAGLFVWAAGTKVALDILSAVLDRLTTIRTAPV